MEEGNAHNGQNYMAEEHDYWQEQGRNALNIQQSGFEGAVKEYEQAARDEVHVAVAQATEMFGRRCGHDWVLSNIKQSKRGLLNKLRYLTR